jgi:hypothetical protein
MRFYIESVNLDGGGKADALSPLFCKKKDQTISLVFCGAEGSRTLVQLCDKLCLLHAYFPINFRDKAGWKPTLLFSLGTLFRSYTAPYKS